MKLNQLSLADENFIESYSEGGATQREYVLKPTRLTPYEAYRVLKERFGQPNSNMFDDMKTQWMYTLQTDEAYFEVYDWKILSWSIAVYLKPSATRTAEDTANDLESIIEQQASKQNASIKEALRKPDGLVIENPYFTYRETADSIYELLDNLKNPETSSEGMLSVEGWIKHYDLCRAAFILYLSSVEGFVNLIYELYLRKELREKRIYDRVSREQIDLKIRLAPVYCECFKDGVLDSENESFKNFHSLANLRNDFVHANFTKPMMKPVIYEDDFEFVIDIDSTTAIGIPSNFREFESEHVEIAKTITQALIDYVVEAMSPRYRREFKSILNEELIRVEYENGQLFIS